MIKKLYLKIKDLYFKYHEIINYLIFGVLTTIVGLGTYYLFSMTILNPDNPIELQITNVLSWIFAVTFAQSYKRITNNMISAGALTVLAEVFAGLAALLFIPLFGMKFPSNIYVYVFLALASIFYALNDRLSTTVRKGLEASTFSMIKQSKTVFMILAGSLCIN